MKKQKIVQLIDIVMYFNVIVFIGSGIIAINQNNNYYLFFICVGILNIIFIALTMRLRINYNKSILKKIENEIITEASMSKESKEAFTNAKQEFLESRIEAEIMAKMPNSKVIRNAYVPRTDGKTSEIDLIVINMQGIFIIEAKNITGQIKGNWKDDKSLKVLHPGGKEYSIVNPIEQNTQHFYSLRNYLGLKSEYFRSIIVFGDLSYIENIYKTPYHAEVCQLDGLINSMNRIANRYGTTLEAHNIDNIFNNLLKFVEFSKEKKEQHIKNISQ